MSNSNLGALFGGSPASRRSSLTYTRPKAPTITETSIDEAQRASSQPLRQTNDEADRAKAPVKAAPERRASVCFSSAIHLYRLNPNTSQYENVVQGGQRIGLAVVGCGTKAGEVVVFFFAPTS